MTRMLAALCLIAALLGLPVAGLAAVLGISGNQFTVDGQATFLWGPTYFDVLDWTQADVNDACNAGARLWRIIVDKQWDSGPSGTESIFNNDGSLNGNESTVHSFIQAADATCGAIVDIVILVSDGSPNSMDWLTSPTVQDAIEAAVVNTVAEFKSYTNVKFDIANEHNADSATNHIPTEMDNLVDLAKTECPLCIIDFSGRGDGNPDNWGIDCGTEQATQSLINEVVGTQADTFNPHLCRQSDWWAKTGSRTQTIRDALLTTAKPNLPIYLSEEARVGSIAGGGAEPTEDNLVQAAVNAKSGGAAAYIFHSAASFQMSGSRMFAQFTTAELNAFNRIAAALSPGGGGGGGSSVGVLQTSPKVSTDAGTSITFTLPAPTTPGTKFLLTLSGGHFDNPSAACAMGTLTDSQGGTWSLDLASPLSTYDVAYVWRRDNAASTQNFSVTLTCSSSSWLTGQLMEVQGLVPGGPDVTGSQSGGFNNALSVTTGATSQPDTFAVGVLADDLSGTSTITESAGWTVRWEQETCDAASGGHQCGQASTRLFNVQGPISHTWTLSQGANLSGGIVVYRAVGSSSGGGILTRTLRWNDVSFDEEWFALQKRTDQSAPNWLDVAPDIAANSTLYIATLAPSETGDCWRIASVKNGWFNDESFIQFSGQHQPSDAIAWSNVACYVPDTPPPPPPPPPAGLGLSGLSLTLDEDLL